MILDLLDHADRYSSLHPDFPRAFEFLRRADLAQLPNGRHEIQGEAVFALVDRPTGRSRSGARLEIHRSYIDIQFTLAGVEVIGWRSLKGCARVAEAYDAARDIGFFGDESECWLTVKPGAFAILFPDDAHAPLAGEGALQKVVIKVRV